MWERLDHGGIAVQYRTSWFGFGKVDIFVENFSAKSLLVSTSTVATSKYSTSGSIHCMIQDLRLQLASGEVSQP